ncbi:MAG: hypothetical protein H0U92_10405 [Actinobacteria bacterium]|nr:hypothetical protein [Actinomycetota bacterium]
MSVDELMAEVDGLLPGAALVDDLTNSNRAHVARISHDHTTYIAKRPLLATALASEVEALQTLPPSTRPALITHGASVVVMEDLGAGESMADLLLGTDPDRAAAALITWATTLGAALKPTLRQGVASVAFEMDTRVDGLRLLADDFGVTVDARVVDDIAAIHAAITGPTPWLVFGPSDACPDNNRVFADGSIKLFDFEGASWRHASAEAAYARAPFCTCWCVAALPPGMTDRMEQAFLAAFAPPDADAFRTTIAPAAIAYCLHTFEYYQHFVETNRPMGPTDTAPSNGRQYVLARLRLIEEQRDGFPHLALLASTLADKMLERWPEAHPMPLYRAFQ